jgi:hypothetical protein
MNPIQRKGYLIGSEKCKSRDRTKESKMSNVLVMDANSVVIKKIRYYRYNVNSIITASKKATDWIDNQFKAV